METRRRDLARCRRALEEATDYAAWYEAATELDRLSGASRWQADRTSTHYHPGLLEHDLGRLEQLSAEGRVDALVDFVQESLYRSMNDVLEPAHYAHAATGPKHLVTRWLDAMEAAIEWLACTELPGWPATRKLAVVRAAYKNLGRSALLLSGGATLGFYHLGVVRALWRAGLLPDVIAGASMGAMIAAGICSRTDAELDDLFATGVPDIETAGIAWLPLAEAWRTRTLLRPERMLETIKKNCGHYTFTDAFERSGRVLNISLMPTRTRQKPRVLSHLTAPDVWVWSAALASSAVPGLFPPASLIRRSRDGSDQPYIAGETWTDGSFGADLPTERVGRLHNVNHFIVSQTQPHILPVMAGESASGLRRLATEVMVSTARSQGLQALAVARRLTPPGRLHAGIELAHTLVQQEYRGDIDIHPRFDLRVYRKLLTNATRKDLAWFVREGERATWPKLAMIRDATRISRCLARCERRLAAQAQAD